MKTFKKYLFTILICVIASCASNPKNIATDAEIEALNKVVSTNSFEILASFARPLATGSVNSLANAGLIPPGSTPSRIDVSGSASYLRVIGDRVEANLPYFGERQISAAYNSNNTGIKFDGIPKDFELVPNAKTKGYTIRFTIDGGTETYQVIAQLTPSLLSSLNINSSHRTAIAYEGRIREYASE